MDTQAIIEKFKSIPLPTLVDLTHADEYVSYGNINSYIIGSKASGCLDGCECKQGMTKSVFLFDDCPEWVFKVPVLSISEYQYDFDSSDYVYVCEHSVGNELGSGRDHCILEHELWYSAQDEGLDGCFVKTDCITLLPNDIPLYRSERIETFDYDPSLVGVNDFILNEFGVSREVEMRFVLDYGMDFRDRLSEFLFDNDIYDLHDANWGVGKDGKLKILDYGGFISSSRQ